MVSYDLMDAIKTPPDERVFQHYIDSAGEAVEAFADKVTQVNTASTETLLIDIDVSLSGYPHDGFLQQVKLYGSPVQVFGMVKSHPEGAHRRCSYCLNALMQVPHLHNSLL